MTSATLTSKGQVTIPLEVRNALGLRTGTRIDFVWHDGVYVIVPASHSVTRLAGYFGAHDGPPVTIEQMNDDIAQAGGEPS